MKNTEAIERCKTLIAEEKMLKEQKAILQGEKFADTVPSVQTVIDDIDDYLAKIPGAKIVLVRFHNQSVGKILGCLYRPQSAPIRCFHCIPALT